MPKRRKAAHFCLFEKWGREGKVRTTVCDRSHRSDQSQIPVHFHSIPFTILSIIFSFLRSQIQEIKIPHCIQLTDNIPSENYSTFKFSCPQYRLEYFAWNSF
jgi:hypothetical protein